MVRNPLLFLASISIHLVLPRYTTYHVPTWTYRNYHRGWIHFHAQVQKWPGVLQIHSNWHPRYYRVPLPWHLCWCKLANFCQILRNIWIGSEISLFSGVPVLRDENNLTESRSCHHWDVQVMNNSIFHHSQTSNTGYPQSTLLGISLMLMLLSEFSQ